MRSREERKRKARKLATRNGRQIIRTKGRLRAGRELAEKRRLGQRPSQTLYPAWQFEPPKHSPKRLIEGRDYSHQQWTEIDLDL